MLELIMSRFTRGYDDVSETYNYNVEAVVEDPEINEAVFVQVFDSGYGYLYSVTGKPSSDNFYKEISDMAGVVTDTEDIYESYDCSAIKIPEGMPAADYLSKVYAEKNKSKYKDVFTILEGMIRSMAMFDPEIEDLDRKEFIQISEDINKRTKLKLL